MQLRVKTDMEKAYKIARTNSNPKILHNKYVQKMLKIRQNQSKMPKMAHKKCKNHQKMLAKPKNKHNCEKFALTAPEASELFSIYG